MLDDDPLMTSVMVDAAPHQVFPFFTDPTRLSRWLGHAADTDPVVGGGFAVDINDRLIRAPISRSSLRAAWCSPGATYGPQSYLPAAAGSRLISSRWGT